MGDPHQSSFSVGTDKDAELTHAETFLAGPRDNDRETDSRHPPRVRSDHPSVLSARGGKVASDGIVSDTLSA